ncbi:MAG: arginine deiminase [Spirochaetia bacterium]|nr:arginine deiminase [Spirochaetia bacterium]MCF7941811.1 arginine deiminase [Spirochaetia bacterium]
MNTTPIDISIHSEIAPLRSVLLHRPGRELESLTPQYLDAMLFEDIPFLLKMQEEHDKFAQTLRDQGCTVLYVEELLAQTIARSPEAQERLIVETISDSGVKDQRIKEDIYRLLADMTPEDLAQRLISGVLKQEVPITRETPDLAYYIRDEYPYYVTPLPNLYFTRDPGTAIGDGFSINRMKTAARQRETLLLSVIFDTLTTSLSSPGSKIGLLREYTDGSSIEGGDILILNDSTIAVGCSARSEPWAIERLAASILQRGGSDTGFQRMMVIQIPFTRAYMHLDTVFTMVDSDKFTIYPGVESRLKVFIIEKDVKGELQVHQGGELRSALRDLLGVPAVDLIQTGGGDLITAAREQWNDSTNTLALAPGKVVTYRRNVVSNDTLDAHGIEVLAIEGSELVRGRGGPRCMSMPLFRESSD